MDSRERWHSHKSETWYSEQKIVFTIMWNMRDFYVIDVLLNDTKMNNAYFVRNILNPFGQVIFSGRRAVHEKWFVVRVDNCSVHTSTVLTDWLEEHEILRMLHSFCSSDLASVTYTCFLQWKKYSKAVRWLTKTNCLGACKRLCRYRSIEHNWMTYFRRGCGGFKK
jgi:hypothetical protein